MQRKVAYGFQLVGLLGLGALAVVHLPLVLVLSGVALLLLVVGILLSEPLN